MIIFTQKILRFVFGDSLCLDMHPLHLKDLGHFVVKIVPPNFFNSLAGLFAVLELGLASKA